MYHMFYIYNYCSKYQSMFHVFTRSLSAQFESLWLEGILLYYFTLQFDFHVSACVIARVRFCSTVLFGLRGISYARSALLSYPSLFIPFEQSIYFYP